MPALAPTFPSGFRCPAGRGSVRRAGVCRLSRLAKNGTTIGGKNHHLVTGVYERVSARSRSGRRPFFAARRGALGRVSGRHRSVTSPLCDEDHNWDLVTTDPGNPFAAHRWPSGQIDPNAGSIIPRGQADQRERRPDRRANAIATRNPSGASSAAK